jgi:flagellar L-ring protein FlgH
LFQRPPRYVAQYGNSEPRGEVLPAPAVTPRGGNETINGAMTGNANTPANSSVAPATFVPQAGAEAPVLGMQTSWTYVPPIPSRTLKVHDLVQIRIEESSTSLAVGNATSRKTTSYDAVFKDWIRLVGLDTLKPAIQKDGDPRLQTAENEVYRGDSATRTSSSLTTNIAAEIADIRPNGLLVLNATRTIRENDNTFVMSLSGTCRSQDIGPDNVVLSRNIFNPIIDKQETGHVRDGYSRGWLTKLWARIKPF